MRSSAQYGGKRGPEWEIVYDSENEVLVKFKGNAVIKLYKNFFGADEARQLYDELNRDCPWAVSKIKMFGRELEERRETCLMVSDKDISYTYSGVKKPAYMLNSPVSKYADRIEQHFGEKPNLFLLNKYTNDQYICEHSDDEKDIDQTCSIWSLSLGQERTIIIREKKSKLKSVGSVGRRTWRLVISMPHGTLLEFCPEMQEWFTHEVPKPKTVDTSLYESRINITARTFNKTH
jgi:alkylated DNA repair dioxygenase AlkB